MCSTLPLLIPSACIWASARASLLAIFDSCHLRLPSSSHSVCHSTLLPHTQSTEHNDGSEMKGLGTTTAAQQTCSLTEKDKDDDRKSQALLGHQHTHTNTNTPTGGITTIDVTTKYTDKSCVGPGVSRFRCGCVFSCVSSQVCFRWEAAPTRDSPRKINT